VHACGNGDGNGDNMCGGNGNKVAGNKEGNDESDMLKQQQQHA
jgi:hypothetical protein